MGERPARRHRVLIEDARRDGHHLRATWHPDVRQFVVSTWHADVCTGATRLAVDDVAQLTGLLVDGLADAATARRPRAGDSPAPPPAPGGLAGFVARLRWLVRGGPAASGSATRVAAGASASPRRDLATVRPLRRDTA
jgi:hypothetical protein